MSMRSILSVVATTALLTALGTTPAQADGSLTLSGPSTGDADVFLTYVSCSDLFAPAAAPQSRINLGPYDVPLGRRSLGLVPPAAGSASGPFVRFDSLAAADSSLAVAATAGSQGVSYVMTITPSNPPGTAWQGRASLTAAAGSWSTVSSAALTYDWSLVDLGTLAPLSSAGAATPSAFAAEHGDGPGFVVTGFGCDGQAFNLDAVSGSGSTFDFEGIALTTDVQLDRPQAAAGESVTLTGRVTDGGGRVTGDPLVLESRVPGGVWAPVGQLVLSGPGGLARVDVPVTETTEFRWHRPESQYADEGWSDAVTVTVTQPATTPAPSDPSSPAPTPDPSAPTPDPSPAAPNGAAPTTK